MVTIPKRSCMSRASATEYRLRFKKDVVVDIFCYRRHGHNEGTTGLHQPADVSRHRRHPTTREALCRAPRRAAVVTEAEAEQMVADSSPISILIRGGQELSAEQSRLARRGVERNRSRFSDIAAARPRCRSSV